MASIALLVFGVLAFGQTMVSLERGQSRTREAGRATQAARARAREHPRRGVPASHSAASTATRRRSGRRRHRAGWQLRGGRSLRAPRRPDGLPGEVIFPTPVGFPGQLVESVNNPRWACRATSTATASRTRRQNYSTSYTVLPVLVRVRWMGSAGPAQVELRSMLGAYR
jgi:hypothetical protein